MTLQLHSILADLALRLARSPEDVATEGLAYILGRFKAAPVCIQRLAADWTPAVLRPIALFRSQVGAADGSRPDLEAHDAEGKPAAPLSIAEVILVSGSPAAAAKGSQGRP
jgi:hypothetical protein